MSVLLPDPGVYLDSWGIDPRNPATALVKADAPGAKKPKSSSLKVMVV